MQYDVGNEYLEQLAREEDEYENYLNQIGTGQNINFLGYGFDELDDLKSGKKQYVPGELISYGLDNIFKRRS